MMNYSNMVLRFGRILFVIFLILTVNGDCHGYVMPAEQMLDFMARNFSNFNTVEIVQSTLQTGQDSERVFMEQLLLKSPDLFELKSLDRLSGRSDLPNMAYRQLLMANSRSRLEKILSMMGINLQAVSLTRIDGVIAYRIGDKADGEPKLLIEKERFLPLLLIYRPGGDTSGRVITVRFQDYRKEGNGWYPFLINYSEDSKIKEEYSIQNLQTNVQTSTTSLKTLELSPSP